MKDDSGWFKPRPWNAQPALIGQQQWSDQAPPTGPDYYINHETCFHFSSNWGNINEKNAKFYESKLLHTSWHKLKNVFYIKHRIKSVNRHSFSLTFTEATLVPNVLNLGCVWVNRIFSTFTIKKCETLAAVSLTKRLDELLLLCFHVWNIFQPHGWTICPPLPTLASVCLLFATSECLKELKWNWKEQTDQNRITELNVSAVCLSQVLALTEQQRALNKKNVETKTFYASSCFFWQKC